MSFDLDRRHQELLWATIRQYISTAEPVGSKTLVDGCNLKVSSATIRNGFATLEKAGLLYQPHTSAGRVPSDLGYRLYVDRSISPSPDFGRRVQRSLSTKIDWQEWNLEAILRGTAEILANLSGYIAMVTLPQHRRSTIEHLQLVCVEPSKIMAVAIWDNYDTQSILWQLPSQLNWPADRVEIESQLQSLSNFLNLQLRGRSVADFSSIDRLELTDRFPQYVELVKHLVANLAKQAVPIRSSQLELWGIAEFLHQPEFSQMQQVRSLLHLLESERNKVCELIFNPIGEFQLADANLGTIDRQLPTIRIGVENPLEPMQSCALISTNYYHNSLPVGSVSLLGPKRMLYEKAIALVQSAANYLSSSLSIGNKAFDN
jgi:heat-inducible transcriptional repressor